MLDEEVKMGRYPVLFAVALCVMLLASVGCDDGSETDGDADVDGDGDVDGGGDADADADADEDEDEDEGEPLGEIGAACTDNLECASAFCITEDFLPEATGGYCTEICDSDDEESCGDNAICVGLGMPVDVCMKQCEGPADCREDYSCVGVCFPGDMVVYPTPGELLEVDDEILLSVVGSVDQERLRDHIELLSGEVEWERPEGSVTITSRSTEHPDHALAVDYLVEQFTEMGLDVDQLPFDFETHMEYEDRFFSGTGTNIEARLEGTDPELSPILVTAHYDSVAYFTDGWVWETDPAPGAVDNASGVAIVLELADILSELAATDPAPRTFKFVLFDVEELGLIGSADYVEDISLDDEPLCAMNIDMIAWEFPTWPGRFWYSSRPQDSDLYALDVEALADFVPEAEPLFSNSVDSLLFNGSDHIPFWESGRCATYFSNMPVDGLYHTLDDRVDTYEWPFYMDVARSAAAIYTAWGYRWSGDD